MTTALLVIDVQVGVVVECWDLASVVSRIASLVSRARETGTPVIWVQHEDAYLVKGSKPWALVPELVPADGELRIYKTLRDVFGESALGEALGAHGVKELVVVGSQSDYCVRTAAQSALANGFNVTLVRDAHTTEDSEDGGVKISGEQIVAHTNTYFDDFKFREGVSSRVVAADEVEFK
jgi:nicotinamidase-related amidase